MKDEKRFERGTEARLKSLVKLFQLCVLISSLILIPFATAKEWPTKNITINLGASAGGFVDTSTRTVVSEMSKILGVPIVPVNVTGGGGGIAALTTFNAPRDGYTWQGHGSQFRTFGVMGFHASSPKDWYVLPTVSYVGAIAVKEDSRLKTFPDLVEELKKNPGKIPYGASQPSTAWRIGMEVLFKGSGLSGRFVPYQGSAPTHIGLLSEDIQFMMTGIGEQVELLNGRKIRALAVFDNKPYPVKGYGEIPSITDFIPQLKPHLPFYAWSSISLHADVPEPILRKIDGAFLKAMKTKSVLDYCEKFEALPMGLVWEEAQKLFYRQAAMESWLLYEIGVAKQSPEKFGMPKP